jgi:hypothetical protein
MKNYTVLGVIFCLFSGFCSAENFGKCDEIQSIINRSGALKTSQYKMGDKIGYPNNRLVADLQTSPQCVNSIAITTLDPEVTSLVGDAVVKRKFSFTNDLTMRFLVKAPTSTPTRLAQGDLVFRDIMFRSTLTGATVTTGHLIFALHNSGNRDGIWSMTARMEYSNGVITNFGDIYTARNSLDPKFDVLFEYVDATLSPSLKLTYTQPNGSIIVANSALYPGLRPVVQSIGLLPKTNMTLNRTFTVQNCVAAADSGICPR